MIRISHIGVLTIVLMSMQPLVCFASGFKQASISKELLQAMQKGNTFSEASPVSSERLQILTIPHIDFEGNIKEGQMIVLDTCAEAVLNIFKALYEQKFPIYKMQLLHHYHGDDEKSMADNNSSSHNCRVIAGISRVSLHAYGVAIDINPIENPCLYIDSEAATATYVPKAGIQYANRRLKRIGKAYRSGMAEEVVAIFAKNGFYYWGGDWDTPIDYQHFQLGRGLTELYVAMKPKAAKETFDKVIAYFNRYQQPIDSILKQQLEIVYGREGTVADYYKSDEKLFDKVLNEVLKGPKRQ